MPYPQKLSEQQILDEAERLVDEEGLDALSTRTLARRLNVRAPSLYRYFPDKESLIQAVGARFLGQLADELSQQQGLADLARAYWAYGLRYPNRYDVVVCRMPEVAKSLTQNRFQVTEPLHTLAQERAPDHHLAVARVIWSYLHGALSLRLDWPTRDGLNTEAAFMAGVQALESWLQSLADSPAPGLDTGGNGSAPSSPANGALASDADRLKH